MIVIIPAELFEFLRDLKENNNRPWFQANKDRYEKYYKEPLLAFISEFADRLPQISPYYTAIPKMTGGSLFRIYRDMRFSADKRPYKTWAAMHFRHERAPDVHSPGFYLHLEPGSCFISCGIWKPESRTLQRVRLVISEHPQRWLDAISGPDFQSNYHLAGDALQQAPRGFDANHPMIEDLKRKDFLASHPITEKTALRDDFLDLYTDLCLKSAPFMSFLTESIGLAW
jgi:uncharacterized protein (TIGR02453 family)